MPSLPHWDIMKIQMVNDKLIDILTNVNSVL